MERFRLLATAGLAASLALGLLASAQTTSQGAQKPAPNAWMLTPTPYLEWNKDVPHSVRVERDRYLDRLAAGQRYPLTSPHADPLGPGHGSGMSKAEIPSALDRVVLTGTFSKHRSVLSASEFSLYSEVTIHVDEVFQDQGGSGAAPGKDITILLTGGAVTLASGRVLTYNTQPMRFCLQPDNKYLLVLSYYDRGDFYLVMDHWDISSGIVRPDTEPDVYRATHGLSSLNGLRVEQLSPALTKLLQESQ